MKKLYHLSICASTNEVKEQCYRIMTGTKTQCNFTKALTQRTLKKTAPKDAKWKFHIKEVVDHESNNDQSRNDKQV